MHCLNCIFRSVIQINHKTSVFQLQLEILASANTERIFKASRIQLKCHCISSLPSKQIQTECLFDDPQPFFLRRIKSTIMIFFLFTFALFARLKHKHRSGVVCRMKFNEKRANYSSLLIFAGLCAIPLRASTAIFVPRDAQILCKLFGYVKIPPLAECACAQTAI